MPDSNCTQCHADLQKAGSMGGIARTVTLFTANHPEFRVKLAGEHDPGTIKLNHAVHLAKGLKGPHGPVQMECGDCHRASNSVEPWPYGQHSQPASIADFFDDRSHETPYMSPIRYGDQCAGCHTLEFDRRLAGEQVPHDKPEQIHRFLTDRYRKFIASNPAALHDESPQLRRIVNQPPPRHPHTAEEWVTVQVAAAEELLWQKTCKECHSPTMVASGLPEIPKAAIPQRWMQASTFDHNRHRIVGCENCHERARTSKETSDVLLPAIATCRQCHTREKEAGAGADARCFECHTYHDWSREHRVKPPYSIPQIRGTAPLRTD